MSCLTKARRANTCLTLLLLAQFSILAQDAARTNPPSQQNNPFGRAEVPDSEESRRFIRAHSFDNPLFRGQQAEIAQSLEQAAKQVRMIYLVPSNKSARADYQDAIANAISDLQRFYKDQIGGGYAFTLHSPTIEVYQTPHTAEFYSTGDNARPGGLWEGVLADGFALTGGGFNDPNNRWIFYVDVDPICGQFSGGTSGVALLPANDLRGLTNQPTVPICSGDPSTVLSVNRWIGGLGHELGHAFNLPHPPGCDSGDCTGGLYAYNSLMYVGYSIYPNTYLLDENKTQLLGTGFFSVQNPIQVTVQTNPAGRAFTVDGTHYSTTQIFSWVAGSSHAISTTSPQSGATGAQYVWNNWSDGGVIAHAVTAPGGNITYITNFTTQYFLTMNAGTGGTVSPSNGWYNSGTSVGISATPNPSFVFNSWSGTGAGSFNGTGNPTTITMNGPVTQAAAFAQPLIQLLLDQSGPSLDQLAALDSILFVRDPFPVVNSADVLNLGVDRNTRVIVFVTNLQLAQSETSSSVVVNLVDSNNQSYDVAAEDVRFLSNSGFTQVIFRLPNSLAVGTCTIKVRAHSQVSNVGTIRIRT
ncbi:MAG: hypothetical protein QOG23_3322 [Blastocatellia bacterium]|nr:hypothetical protein [Blastocatellia bacterium]